ncbi:MAG TPA: hypothetical protein VGJ02_04020 [Pyrinomonadaceae bacterium]
MMRRNRFLLRSILLITPFILFASERSFAQPEGSGAIMAIEEKPSAGGGRASQNTAEGQGRTGTPSRSAVLPAKTPTKRSTKTRPSSTSRPLNVDANGRYLGPVLGDTYSFLNFEMVDKVQPVWTLAAKNAGALGLVQVAVLIGENGEVLQAKARSGNSLLYPEAEKAALASRLNKPTADGRPARALGFIVYRFGTEEQEYEQEQKKRAPELLI